MTSFVVVTPSRGLLHSRTVEAVTAAVDQAIAAGHDFRGWRLSHDLPIPDCHELVAEAGLATGADALWFVEEDTIPPAGALLALLEVLEERPIAAIDYPVGDAGTACIARDLDGEICWCGLGCTLVRREVFDTLPRPWFTTDWVYLFRRGALIAQPNPAAPADRYGQQDIHFFLEAARHGFRIGQVPGMTARQARVVELGAAGTNVGAHRIALEEIRQAQRPEPFRLAGVA